MHEIGCSSWYAGMTHRDRMGKEVGGEFRMGNIHTPVVDSCQCMAKSLQYCKVIGLQLKQINKFIFKINKEIKASILLH